MQLFGALVVCLFDTEIIHSEHIFAKETFRAYSDIKGSFAHSMELALSPRKRKWSKQTLVESTLVLSR